MPPPNPSMRCAGAPLAGWQLGLQPQPDEALRRAIMAPLLAFNEATAGPSGHQVLALALRRAAVEAAGDGSAPDPQDPAGVEGGLWAVTHHGWLYTQLLVVPAAARGLGLGRALMLQAEAEARRRGCHHAWVDTQFGARAFYERLGYAVFGELPDFPTGFTRSFLAKAL